MEKIKLLFKKLIDHNIILEERFGLPRIDGKSEASEIAANNCIILMKNFHLWIDKNYLKGTHFDVNGFYIPRLGQFTNHTLDELIEIYLNENL